MSETTIGRRHSRTSAFVSLVVAAGMLIACVVLFTRAYGEAERHAEEAAARQKQKPTTPANPDEPPAVPGASLSDAFDVARGDPWFWWALTNGVALSGLGVFFLVRTPGATDPELLDAEERLWARLGYFALCSIVSFFTVACLALPYTWIKSSELLSREGWRSYQPWLIVLAYILGLGGMFISLLAVKSQERASAGLRRWIYGYNAFLGGFLFLAILGVVNAWFALYGPDVSDWTASNIYSISPATKRLLKDLDKPVKAYVIMPVGSVLYDDVMNMLNTCKTYTDQLDVEAVSPQADRKLLEQLFTKYDVLRDVGGVDYGLLLVQDPNAASPASTYLKVSDLSDSTSFRGEAAFFNALREFREGKKRPVVYFTQDSGELSIDPTALQRREVSPDRAAAKLKEQLTAAGYDVKPLKLGERKLGSNEPPKVPDDASAVVVADPLRMDAAKAAVLQAYLKRDRAKGIEPGRVVFLLDVHGSVGGKVAPTGLEPLLSTYGVQVGANVVYSVVPGDPTRIPVLPIPNMERELAGNLNRLLGRQFLYFPEARSVSPPDTPPGAGSPADVKPLLVAYSDAVGQGNQLATWTEDTIRPNPEAYVKEFAEKREKELVGRLATTFVAVTVRDRGTPTGPPGNPMQPPTMKPGLPRAVVFGDASFVTDAEVQKSGETGPRVVQVTLAWLRGRTDLAEIESEVKPRERTQYRLLVTSPEELRRIFWLPLLWLLLGTIATGVGVGLLRRR